jgi:hypothetical protein
MINVVNKRTHTETADDYYVGRGSVLGCPFTIKPLNKTKAQFHCSTRDEAIESYRTYLLEKISQGEPDICDMLNKIYRHARKGDVNLVCYCAPQTCHADVIKEIVDQKIQDWVFKMLHPKKVKKNLDN